MREVPFFGVKSPNFSFQRLLGADPRLGVEMASTGEVACYGKTVHNAFLKSVLSSYFKWPTRKRLLISNITEGKSSHIVICSLRANRPTQSLLARSASCRATATR